MALLVVLHPNASNLITQAIRRGHADISDQTSRRKMHSCVLWDETRVLCRHRAVNDARIPDHKVTWTTTDLDGEEAVLLNLSLPDHRVIGHSHKVHGVSAEIWSRVEDGVEHLVRARDQHKTTILDASVKEVEEALHTNFS